MRGCIPLRSSTRIARRSEEVVAESASAGLSDVERALSLAAIGRRRIAELQSHGGRRFWKGRLFWSRVSSTSYGLVGVLFTRALSVAFGYRSTPGGWLRQCQPAAELPSRPLAIWGINASGLGPEVPATQSLRLRIARRCSSIWANDWEQKGCPVRALRIIRIL